MQLPLEKLTTNSTKPQVEKGICGNTSLWLIAIILQLHNCHFTSILFEPIDVAAQAKAAGDKFPNNHVQIKGDYFSMNKVDVSWEIGHVGVSDYLHKYWPIAYQISKGE